MRSNMEGVFINGRQYMNVQGIGLYAFEEHTPENTVKFLKMLFKEFPFEIQKIQTDNDTEFTYKYISDNENKPIG